LRVFRRLGYRDVAATPLAVAAFTPEAFTGYQAGRRQFSNGLVFMAPSAGSSRWCGHVGLLVDGDIVDPSAGQAARPEQGLDVPRAVVVAAGSRPPDNRNFAVVVKAGNAVLAYALMPDYQGHQRSPLWNDHRLIAEVADAVLSVARPEPDRGDMAGSQALSAEATGAEIVSAHDLFGSARLAQRRSVANVSIPAAGEPVAYQGALGRARVSVFNVGGQLGGGTGKELGDWESDEGARNPADEYQDGQGQGWEFGR